MLILDVVGGDIACVEVLYREDVRKVIECFQGRIRFIGPASDQRIVSVPKMGFRGAARIYCQREAGALGCL